MIIHNEDNIYIPNFTNKVELLILSYFLLTNQCRYFMRTLINRTFISLSLFMFLEILSCKIKEVQQSFNICMQEFYTPIMLQDLFLHIGFTMKLGNHENSCLE